MPPANSGSKEGCTFIALLAQHCTYIPPYSLNSRGAWTFRFQNLLFFIYEYLILFILSLSLSLFLSLPLSVYLSLSLCLSLYLCLSLCVRIYQSINLTHSLFNCFFLVFFHLFLLYCPLIQVHQAVISAGKEKSGCTVHLVTEQVRRLNKKIKGTKMRWGEVEVEVD